MKLNLVLTEWFTTTSWRKLEIDTDDYPELAGMTEEQAQQYIQDKYDAGDLNEVYDEGELIGSKVTSVPSSLLFDYSDNPPSAVLEIDEFREIQNAGGDLYKVIDIVTILDSVYQYIPKVDSVVTIFSNEVITHFAPDSLKDLDYIITKTNTALPSGLGYNINEYTYLHLMTVPTINVQA